MNRELRDYQKNAIEALRATIRQGVRKIMVQAPTGSGKTACAAAIVEGVLAKGNRVAFVCPYVSLIDQTVQMFYEEGISEIGVQQASHPMEDASKPVQVCTIQTLQARKTYPEESQLVLLDEAHLLHEYAKGWLEHPHWQDRIFIGLSATPFTKGLGKFFDTMIIAATTRELIDRGFLSKFRIFASGHPDLRDVKIVASEYVKDQLSAAMQKGTLVADIVENWQKHWGKDKTLCFGVDRAHAKSIQDRFLAAGVTCAYQDANTSLLDRADIKRRFHAGEYQVISNVDTLSVGVDYDVRCLILARPTRSESRYLQIVGRALRIADGKEHAVIFDHSDTTQRLGFPDQVFHDHLHVGNEVKKVEKPKPKPRECQGCHELRLQPGPCPCGFVPANRQNQYAEADGELMDVTDGARRAKVAQVTLEEKGIFYAELKAYGIERGYAAGWAANKYREKYDVWPDWSIKHVSPRPVSLKMRSWIKSRQIAYAKSKRRLGHELPSPAGSYAFESKPAASEYRRPWSWRDL